MARLKLLGVVLSDVLICFKRQLPPLVVTILIFGRVWIWSFEQLCAVLAISMYDTCRERMCASSVAGCEMTMEQSQFVRVSITCALPPCI